MQKYHSTSWDPQTDSDPDTYGDAVHLRILRPDATEVEVVVMVGGHQASHTTERSSRHVQNGSSAASACSAPK